MLALSNITLQADQEAEIASYVPTPSPTPWTLADCCCELKNRMKWDDALDVWGVHGMGGALGSILIGVFADPAVSGGGPAASGELFGKQLAATAIAAVYSYFVTVVLLKLIGLVLRLKPTKVHPLAATLTSIAHVHCPRPPLTFTAHVRLPRPVLTHPLHSPVIPPPPHNSQDEMADIDAAWHGELAYTATPGNSQYGAPSVGSEPYTGVKAGAVEIKINEKEATTTTSAA